MPVTTREEANMLKARIFDLSEKGAKKVLFGMVDILKGNHDLLRDVFIDLICFEEKALNFKNRLGSV